MNSSAAELKVIGVVQGVGFRYFTFRKAQEYNLSGWVKNCSDRSVMIYVEGDSGLINDFIKTIKIGPASSSVSDLKISHREFTGNFDKFEIMT